MKIKSQKDFWSGLLFVAIGLAFAWRATAYAFGSSESPGTGIFPFGLGLLMTVLGGVLLFKSLAIETDDGDPIGAWALRPLLVLVGSVALFGLALPRLGLALSLPLLVVTGSLAGKAPRWRDVAVSSVALTLGGWLLFVVGLKLAIPLWPSFAAG